MLLLSISLINMFIGIVYLAYHLDKTQVALGRARQAKEVYKERNEDYFLRHLEDLKKNRSNRLLIDELMEENNQLKQTLEHEASVVYDMQEALDKLAGEKQELEDKVQELETYIMEIEYGEDM